MDGADVSALTERAKALNSERMVLVGPNVLDSGGQVLPGMFAAAAVAAESYSDRVFQLTPSASSTDVISGKDNMFQVCFTDPNQGVGSADYISQNMPGAKVGIIYRNDDAYSQGIRDTFVAEAGKVGLEIVSEGPFTKDTQSDFSVQLTAAQSAGADLIFLPTYYQPNAVILNQAKGMGYAPTFFGVDGMDGILAMPGFDTSLAEGVMLLTPFSADADDERTQSFVSKYNEEICEAIVAVMPTISVDGLTGQGMTWAATGEVSKAPMAVVIKDGVYVTP